MSRMNVFRKADDSTSQVEYLHALYPFLNLDPLYQREGGIWSIEKKQLFIDSLINGFDVPKIYLNRVEKSVRVEGIRHYVRYEVIDGKQRIETTEEFLNDAFPLASDFLLRSDEDINIGGKFFSDLVSDYPEVSFELLKYRFDIVVLDAVDENLVDEFFLRLNDGEPLNAQEKRAACNCFLRDRVKYVAKSNRFVNTRLRSLSRNKNDELVAKFFSIAEQLSEHGRVFDIKKNRLDRLYQRSKNGELKPETVRIVEKRVTRVLSNLCRVFKKDDPLLVSIGNVVVFYLAAFVRSDLWSGGDVRSLVQDFEEQRKSVVNQSYEEMSYTDFRLYCIFDEYNSLVQSANDGAALMHRAQFINWYIEADGDLISFVNLIDKSME